MKRIALAAAAALTLVGSLATPASAQTWNSGHQGNGNRNDGNRNDGNRNDGNRNDDRRDNNNRGDQRGQWSNQGRFSSAQNWRRGDRISAYEQNRYRAVDYRRSHLRAPPRGYRYIQDDRGDTLLVGIATGVILSILMNQ